MTKRFLSILSVASLLAVLAPFSVSTGAAEISCRVPFSFTANGTTLPPGFYTLSSQRNMLLIRGSASGVIVLANPMASGIETEPKLVFEKYGDNYVLREMWMGGGSGRELPWTRIDRERSKTAWSGRVERIVIAAM